MPAATINTPSRIPGASAALVAALDVRDSYIGNRRDPLARDMMVRAFHKVPAREARACAAAVLASDTADAGECIALTMCLDVIVAAEGGRRDAVLAEIEGLV